MLATKPTDTKVAILKRWLDRYEKREGVLLKYPERILLVLIPNGIVKGAMSVADSPMWTKRQI